MQTITIGGETVKQETLVPLDEQDNPVTLYGGKVTIYEDGSADVVSAYGLAEITSVTPKDSFATNLDGRGRAGYNFSSLGIPSAKKKLAAQQLKVNAMATQSSLNIFNYGSAYSVGCHSNGEIVYITLSAAENTIVLFNKYLDTIGTVQLCYPLATPFTYHFTNLEELKVWLGENHFWCDISDDISVKYWNRGFGN